LVDRMIAGLCVILPDRALARLIVALQRAR
jgi:hypothetical protein